jgi:2-polyprenyl-3-methyl-5-hydroxy-6-metoxy-1,4-benzoquinol methylase
MSTVAYTLSHPSTAEAPRCNICNGISRRYFQLADYWVYECNSCGHQFTETTAGERHIAEVYGDDYFSNGGAGYTDYVADERLLVQRGRWYADRISQFCQPGAMLDVGAAAGFTARGFADSGWDVFGLEPNRNMAEYARSHLGVSVEATSLENWCSDRRFDLVSMLQVLPHFIDPRNAVRQVARHLHIGGFLLIETWNRNSWMARIFGKSWHVYNPPSVLHWFSRDTLQLLLANEGFSTVAEGQPARRISLRHAKSILRHKAEVSFASRMGLLAARLLPENLTVSYHGDDLFWMLFRQSGAIDCSASQYGAGQSDMTPA